MPLHREAIHAFRLGHAAESFNVWDDNSPLSRQDAYSSLKDNAGLLTLEIPEYKESSIDFINELSRRINHCRPDLMDAFMMGRGAARLVILLAETNKNNEDRGALLENTKQGVAYGARRLGIATGALENWIRDLEKLIHDVRKNSADSMLIMAHIERLENLVGQTQSGSIVMQVEKAHMQFFSDIKDSTVINESLVVGSFTKIKEEMDKESAEVWLQIANMVHKSGNVAAGALFDKLSDELQKETREKPCLGSTGMVLLRYCLV